GIVEVRDIDHHDAIRSANIGNIAEQHDVKWIRIEKRRRAGQEERTLVRRTIPADRNDGGSADVIARGDDERVIARRQIGNLNIGLRESGKLRGDAEKLHGGVGGANLRGGLRRRGRKGGYRRGFAVRNRVIDRSLPREIDGNVGANAGRSVLAVQESVVVLCDSVIRAVLKNGWRLRGDVEGELG